MEDEVYQQSQQGLDLLYKSIITLLKANPNGLTNTEVTRKLGLQSEYNGKKENYLSYSLLGNLMKKNIVEKFKTNERAKNSYYILTFIQ
ncbi:hypothetical protein Barb6_00380 [Bacteroidales bacterium Barb6]|nr:hypothetical protein Barb6_00380 [Bacteroidales bacterium Barb6]